MNTLRFDRLREANVVRCAESYHHPLHLWTGDDWFTATAGECGEACNVVKKLNRYRDGIVAGDVDRPQLVAMLADEIADGMIYLDLLAARVEVDLFPGCTMTTMLAYARREGVFEGAVNGSQACRQLMQRLGRLALAVQDAPLRHKAMLYALEGVAIALGVLAQMYEIDLAAAIVRKFNATSEKLGFEDRLYLHA